VNAPVLLNLPGLQGLVASAKSNGLALDQAKLNVLWQYSYERAGDAGSIVAQFCLSILPQEGTGSFDTSSENKAADGGNGVEADWQVDVRKAVNLVCGKLELYQQALAQGFGTLAGQVVSPTAGRCDGLPDQWVNWATAVVRTDGTVDGGACYAQHASWWAGVRQSYLKWGGTMDEFLRATTILDQRAPRVNLDMRYVHDEVGLASNWNGQTPEPAVIVSSVTVVAPAPAYTAVTVILPGGATAPGEMRDGLAWFQVNGEWSPLRAWAEAQGFTVAWDEATMTATVSHP
jgi:hypothetical protein